MAKKNNRDTKGRIIEAAWSLFYRQGYDDTTVEEIIQESGTSSGSFSRKAYSFSPQDRNSATATSTSRAHSPVEVR